MHTLRTLNPPEIPSPTTQPYCQDDSQEGYERQYVVVSLANEMAAGALAVSRSGKPDAEQTSKMILAVDCVNKKLKDVMQPCVQMVRLTYTKVVYGITASCYQNNSSGSVHKDFYIWAGILLLA